VLGRSTRSSGSSRRLVLKVLSEEAEDIDDETLILATSPQGDRAGASYLQELLSERMSAEQASRWPRSCRPGVDARLPDHSRRASRSVCRSAPSAARGVHFMRLSTADPDPRVEYVPARYGTREGRRLAAQP